MGGTEVVQECRFPGKKESNKRTRIAAFEGHLNSFKQWHLVVICRTEKKGKERKWKR